MLSSAQICWVSLKKSSGWCNEGPILRMATSEIGSELALPFETASTSDWPKLDLLRFDFPLELEPLPLLLL